MVELNEIRQLAERIAREFNPERIILFGSHAYGTPREESDVDLLVLLKSPGNTFDKSFEILKRFQPDFSADVVVRDPDDAQRRYRECDPLIREAFDRGTVLYDRNR